MDAILVPERSENNSLILYCVSEPLNFQDNDGVKGDLELGLSAPDTYIHVLSTRQMTPELMHSFKVED